MSNAVYDLSNLGGGNGRPIGFTPWVTTTKGLVGHVWRRLGFGPSPGETNASDPRALIDDLLSRPTTTVPIGSDPWSIPTDQNAGLARVMDLLVGGPNQLQERTWWMLHGLVMCGIVDSVYYFDERDHILLARSVAGGATGGYKQYLLDVSTRPGMLKYLSGNTNAVGHPNENYARELLELFSIGRLHPVTGTANYDQNDIREIARALTGWQYDWNNGVTYFSPSQWDPGTKTVLGAARGAANQQ